MASDSLCLVIQRQHIAQENQLWNLQSVDKRALVRCVVVMSTETLIARKRCNVAMPMPDASDFPDLPGVPDELCEPDSLRKEARIFQPLNIFLPICSQFDPF